MEFLLLLALPLLFGAMSGSDGPETELETEADDNALSATGAKAVLADFLPAEDPLSDDGTAPWWDGMERQDGTNTADTLSGGAENDLIFGGAGNDLIDLGEGGNLSFVSAWEDPDLYESFSVGDDTVLGGSGNDAIWDIDGANSLSGGAGDDVLATIDNLYLEPNSTGGLQLDPSVVATPDQIFAGTGNDTLDGDLGDTLTGGEGADQFASWAYQVNAEPVVITDFSAEDHLVIQVAPEVLDFTNTEHLPPDLTTDPETGDVTVSKGGIDLVILRGPVTVTLEQIYVTSYAA